MGRRYILIIAAIALLASAVAFGTMFAVYTIDKNNNPEYSQDGSFIGIMYFDTSYTVGNEERTAKEYYYLVRAEVDVTNEHADDFLVSPTNFNVLSSNAVQPQVFCKDNVKDISKGSTYHFTIYYEIPLTVSYDTLSMTYTGDLRLEGNWTFRVDNPDSS